MKKPAQAGGGDPNVIAHPAFRQVPQCLFPLKTKQARAEYATLAQLLFDAGRLTVSKHRALSSYAMQFDAITTGAAEGRPARASWFTQLDKARNDLGLDDIDKPVAAAENAPTNPFARCGFANRRR